MEHPVRGAFEIYWQDEAQSILAVSFPQSWTMADVYPVLDQMADRMDDGAPEQAVIFDLTGTRLPPDAARHFRPLLTTRVIEHRALKLAVAVTGNSRPVTVMVNIFNRLHQLFHDFPLIGVATLPEAMDFVARFRADN